MLLNTSRQAIRHTFETLVKSYFGIGRLSSSDGRDKASVDRVPEAKSLDSKRMDMNPEITFRWLTRSW